jgi:monothiol glutaredoxin
MSDQVFERIREDVQQHAVLIFMKGDRVFPQGIKRFSNWPTIPQVYVAGEFVGGCDIVHELYQQGELAQIVGKAIQQ